MAAPVFSALDGDPVLEWRALQFFKAGLTLFQAEGLALCPLELHSTVERIETMLAEGCTPECCFDIIAP